jgi:hypothetical protein
MPRNMGGSRVKFKRGQLMLIGNLSGGKSLFKLDNTKRLRN